MKKVLVLSALIALLAAPAMASTPFPSVGVYFNPQGTQSYATLNGGFDETHTAYVIAFAEALVGGAAFKIDIYPEIMILIGEYPMGVQFGELLTGIEIGLTNPVVGFFGQPVRLATLTLFTGEALIDYGRLNVIPHPNYNSVVLADGNANLFPAAGVCAWLTIPVPNEQSSWGQVKSLFQ